MDKRVVWLLAGIGMTVGGWLPDLWGAGLFSLWSLVLGATGGFLGIWLASKISS